MEYLHVSIEINGVKLEVIGNYWRRLQAGSSPGESESVEIEKVLTENSDDIGGMVAYFEDLQGMSSRPRLMRTLAARNCSAMKPPLPAAKWRGRPHESLRLSRSHRRRHRDSHHPPS